MVLQRAEEQFPALRDVMDRTMCLCANKRIISSYSEDLYGPKNKMFSRDLMLPSIFSGFGY